MTLFYTTSRPLEISAWWPRSGSGRRPADRSGEIGEGAAARKVGGRGRRERALLAVAKLRRSVGAGAAVAVGRGRRLFL